MLVVDTNIIAYLYLPTSYTPLAEKLLDLDSQWAAPLLWRSELRNVLCQYVRKKVVDPDTAVDIQLQAEELLAGNEFEVKSPAILKLAHTSNCSAYDCEFVALAQSLNKQLITVDKKIIRAFPGDAIALKSCFSGQGL